MRTSGLMRFHAMPSATGGIARLVSTRLIDAGIDPAPLLARAGLTVEQIDNRDARLSAQSQIKLLEFAADALQDDFIGFHLAQDYDLREIGLLYYVVASSEILADALHRAERYSGIANEGISLQARTGRETAIALNYVGMDRRSDRHQMEFWLMSLVRLCRQLTNRRVVPSRIGVMHHRKKTPAEFRSFLGCEIEFGSSADEVVFPAAVKLMPVVSADPYLNELLQKYFEEALAHRPATWRDAAFERGECDHAAAAARQGRRRRSGPPTRHEPSHACTPACRGGIDVLRNPDRSENRPCQTLFERGRFADLPDRLASRLPRGQRIHARIQALDRNGAATVAGAGKFASTASASERRTASLAALEHAIREATRVRGMSIRRRWAYGRGGADPLSRPLQPP